MASEKGILHGKLMAVLDNHPNDIFTKAEKVALRLAHALTETPSSMEEDLFLEARAHYNDEQMIGLALAISLENFRSRFNRCFGIQPPGRYPKLKELLQAARVPADGIT